jgi:hypothetical protein
VNTDPKHAPASIVATETKKSVSASKPFVLIPRGEELGQRIAKLYLIAANCARGTC